MLVVQAAAAVGRGPKRVHCSMQRSRAVGPSLSPFAWRHTCQEWTSCKQELDVSYSSKNFNFNRSSSSSNSSSSKNFNFSSSSSSNLNCDLERFGDVWLQAARLQL